VSRFSVHRHVVGWNNGGGGGNISKSNRLVAKWIGRWKRLFFSFLPHGWEFRNAGPGNFPKACFTPSHKPTYAYLPLFMGSWNMQEHLDSDQFWFGDGRICRVFPPLCVLYKSTQTCHLFYCTRPKKYIFGGTYFEPTKNLAIMCRKVTRSESILSKTAIFPQKRGRKREISNESARGSSLREANV